MILEDFLADGETQTSAILFPVACERLEESSADRFGHSRPVVHDANLDSVLAFAQVYVDPSRFARDGFTRVHQQVRKHPLPFLLVQPRFAPTFAQDRNLQAVKFRTSPHRMDGALERRFNGAKHPPKGFSRLRELEQGIDQVRHLVHGVTDFPIKFFSLIRVQIALAKELGVGHNGSQWMPQVVRNRTGYTADSRKPLGSEKFLLAALQANSHPFECSCNFRDLIARTVCKRVGKIASFQCAHARYQICQRLCKRIRDQKNHAASCRDRQQPKPQEHAIQAIQKSGSLVIRFQDTETHEGGNTGSQFHGGGQKLLFAETESLWDRPGKIGGIRSKTRESRLLFLLKRAHYHRVAVEKGNLT